MARKSCYLAVSVYRSNGTCVPCPPLWTAPILFVSQFASEYGKWRGSKGAYRSCGVDAVGEVSVGVLPQHAGAAEEQSHCGEDLC